MTDDNWRLTVEDNALIAEFEEGIRTDGDVFAEVNEEFEKLATRPGVDTHVSVMHFDDALNGEVFEKAKEAADAGTEYGITTWIVVSDGIKNMALKSKVDEIPGVETETADDVDEALELARGS